MSGRPYLTLDCALATSLDGPAESGRWSRRWRCAAAAPRRAPAERAGARAEPCPHVLPSRVRPYLRVPALGEDVDDCHLAPAQRGCVHMPRCAYRAAALAPAQYGTSQPCSSTALQSSPCGPAFPKTRTERQLEGAAAAEHQGQTVSCGHSCGCAVSRKHGCTAAASSWACLP